MDDTNRDVTRQGLDLLLDVLGPPSRTEKSSTSSRATMTPTQSISCNGRQSASLPIPLRTFARISRPGAVTPLAVASRTSIHRASCILTPIGRGILSIAYATGLSVTIWEDLSDPDTRRAAAEAPAAQRALRGLCLPLHLRREHTHPRSPVDRRSLGSRSCLLSFKPRNRLARRRSLSAAHRRITFQRLTP